MLTKSVVKVVLLFVLCKDCANFNGKLKLN